MLYIIFQKSLIKSIWNPILSIYVWSADNKNHQYSSKINAIFCNYFINYACDCDFCDIVQSISIKMPYFRREMKFELSSDYERGCKNKYANNLSSKSMGCQLVCLFVCLFSNSSKTANPHEPNCLGRISLGVQMVLG